MNNCICSIQKLTISSFIATLMSFFILIDMINGVFIRNNLLSISVLYKGTTMILVILYLLLSKKTNFKIIAIISIPVFYILIQSAYFGDINVSIKNINWMVKFISISTFYIFFYKLLQQEKYHLVEKIVKYSFVFLTLNFILGFIGLGYKTYDESIGAVGFIYAANEVSILILSLSSILQMNLLFRKNYKYFFIVFLTTLFMSTILTSKVAIFGTIIILLSFITIHLLENFKNFKINRNMFLFTSSIIITIPPIAIFAIYFTLFKMNLIERLSYFYSKLDIITFIFSSRNLKAIEPMNYFYNTPIIEKIFGTSYLALNDWIVEIDLLDFLVSYGVIGVILSYGFLIFIIIKTALNVYNPYKHYIIFMVFLLIAISITGGHLLNSGTAGYAIAILLAMSNIKIKEKQ